MKNALIQIPQPPTAPRRCLAWTPDEIIGLRVGLFAAQTTGKFRDDLIEKAIIAITEISGYSREEILSRKRDEHHALARMIIMWIAVRVANATFSEAARIFGRHHGAIMNAVYRIDAFRDTRPGFAESLDRLVQKITAET
ncbi:MAG: hypothetical protein N3J91_07025 [Verrucomicrobiae bacterium]|nr:hypothetical protein [Verrucomicrobiae bacterium]